MKYVQILMVVLFSTLLCCKGEMDGKINEKNKVLKVYWKGSKGYVAISSKFKMNVEQARVRLLSKLQDEDSKVTKAPGKHEMIIGDYYVFTMPHKLGVTLTGYYVHQKTGRVFFMEDGRPLKKGVTKKIQFRDEPNIIDYK